MMTNRFILILTLLTYQKLDAQRSLGFEQYGCISRSASAVPVTRIWYKTTDGGYVEARYNYDAGKTAGLSVGWTFSASAKRYGHWTFTPTIGLMAGVASAAGLGMNIDWTLGRIEASSIFQSVVAYPAGVHGQCYSWTEVRLEIFRQLVAGIALQQEPGNSWHPGIELAFVAGSWNIPFYVFDPFSKNTWLMAGVSREWSLKPKTAKLKSSTDR